MLVSHLYRILKPSKLNNVVVLVLLLKIISLNYIGYALLISISASITTIYNLKRTNGIVFKYLKKVKIFVSSYNPQITKARVINLNLHKSNITLNSGLSMRVGISEAIRMLFSSSLNLLFILVLSSQWMQIIKKQQKKFLILFPGRPAKFRKGIFLQWAMALSGIEFFLDLKLNQCPWPWPPGQLGVRRGFF